MYGDIPAAGITIRVPNPPKTASLRLPTNDEMLQRLSQQKSIRRSIGRRKSQTEFRPEPEGRRRSVQQDPARQRRSGVR